jgi:branched-chain amino acid aminotransferase
MGFFPEVGHIWLDGELVPWHDARVHVCTHALHYGTGVFEGIRFYETPRGPAVFRLADHMRRFERSAATYRMQLPFDQEQLTRACVDVVHASGLTEGYIRPLAVYGYGNLGILPKECPVSVAVIVYPFPMYLGAEGMRSGVRLTISPWRKTHHSMMPSDAKGSGQYVNSFLSLSDARVRGFDEALLLNQEGFIAEGSGENVFYVSGKDGGPVLITNDREASILPGITRDSVIEIAREFEIETRIDLQITLDDVLKADEAFLTGTAAEVTPIREVDGRQIGRVIPGPVTRRVQERFFATVRGEVPERFDWLTFIREQPLREGADRASEGRSRVQPALGRGDRVAEGGSRVQPVGVDHLAAQQGASAGRGGESGAISDDGGPGQAKSVPGGNAVVGRR